jgi:threonine dehydratase
VIVMPQDAPRPSWQDPRGTAGYGGSEVILYDRYTEDREAIGRRLARERGMTLIPPYDHPHVMAGQGTRRWSCWRRWARSMRCSSASAAAA